MRKTIAAVAFLAALFAAPAGAQERVDFLLNWIPGGDHAPFYYALSKGWYKEAGIDLQIEPGKGSNASVQRVGAGKTPLGISDMATALVARGKGSSAVVTSWIVWPIGSVCRHRGGCASSRARSKRSPCGSPGQRPGVRSSAARMPVRSCERRSRPSHSAACARAMNGCGSTRW